MTITVKQPPCSGPVAANDSYATYKNTALTIAAPGEGGGVAARIGAMAARSDDPYQLLRAVAILERSSTSH